MFKYYLRRAFRDREFMFWSLFFPILLMTCFKLSFMPVAMKDIDFDPVKCAVLTQGEGAYADEFQSVIAELSDEEKAKLKGLPTSLEQALDALEKDHAYLTESGVFPEELIDNLIKTKRKECSDISKIPHPAEFDLYYNN